VRAPHWGQNIFIFLSAPVDEVSGATTLGHSPIAI